MKTLQKLVCWDWMFKKGKTTHPRQSQTISAICWRPKWLYPSNSKSEAWKESMSFTSGLIFSTLAAGDTTRGTSWTQKFEDRAKTCRNKDVLTTSVQGMQYTSKLFFSHPKTGKGSKPCYPTPSFSLQRLHKNHPRHLKKTTPATKRRNPARRWRRRHREGLGGPFELRLQGFHVVLIDVGVAQVVHKLPGLQTTDLQRWLHCRPPQTIGNHLKSRQNNCQTPVLGRGRNSQKSEGLCKDLKKNMHVQHTIWFIPSFLILIVHCDSSPEPSCRSRGSRMRCWRARQDPCHRSAGTSSMRVHHWPPGTFSDLNESTVRAKVIPWVAKMNILDHLDRSL